MRLVAAMPDRTEVVQTRQSGTCEEAVVVQGK